MSAFGEAADAIFEDETIGEDALWHVGGFGAGVPVRVIRSSPDTVVAFGKSRAVLDGRMLDVRASQISAPACGDTVDIGSIRLTIIGTPLLDDMGIVWSCEAQKQ